MKFALYTVVYSPHQVPLFKLIMGLLGEDECRYVAAEPLMQERANMGWGDDMGSKWFFPGWKEPEMARQILKEAEVLMIGIRDLPLIQYRSERGLTTIYCAERWFKPRMGMLRLLRPSYLKMARRFVKLLRETESFMFYPMGIHAARDIARLCGLFAGDLRCLFRAPKLDFERRPGGRIYIREQGIGNREQDKKYCLDKMRMWGYFVEPSTANSSTPPLTHSPTIKVLWVGRLLNLKRVDTIVRAVGEHANLKRVDNSLPKITLDIYGSGPEETRLKKLAAKYGDCIKFYPPVPIDEVRRLMREHDIYVLSSNAYEGWGAVVSEALEEGMKVVGTHEAGSTATILPNTQLFHAGDWRQLRKILVSDDKKLSSIGEWNAKRAAEYITSFVGVRDE